jgi:hypothetical protein
MPWTAIPTKISTDNKVTLACRQHLKPLRHCIFCALEILPDRRIRRHKKYKQQTNIQFHHANSTNGAQPFGAEAHRNQKKMELQEVHENDQETKTIDRGENCRASKENCGREMCQRQARVPIVVCESNS